MEGCGKWAWHVLKNDWHVKPGVNMGWTKKGWRVNCGQQQQPGQALIICGQWWWKRLMLASAKIPPTLDDDHQSPSSTRDQF